MEKTRFPSFNGKKGLYLYHLYHITVELYLKTAFKLCVTVCKKIMTFQSED